jgi:DNA-binding transcriptional ArsR family regulator
MSPQTTIADGPLEISERPTEDQLLAKYFRVLADPTRLRILQELRDQGELSVGELSDRLELAQPSVSNHLACLRWCGFVSARREHRRVYNRIADPRAAEVIGLARSLLHDNAEHVAACRRA